MRYILSTMIYVGIGCAYQSTYDDVSIRKIAMADVPVSTFGHIFAWPFVILYHLLGIVGWGLIGLFVLILLAAIGIWFKDWLDRRARRSRLSAQRRSA